MNEDKFTITNKTKGKLPSLPFREAKNEILGKNYSLSLAIVGKSRIQAANREYRKKDKPTDVLSFSLDKYSGEILINPETAKEKAKENEENYKNYLFFIFIHGCLHLKGMDHGSKMTNKENQLRASFGF